MLTLYFRIPVQIFVVIYLVTYVNCIPPIEDPNAIAGRYTDLKSLWLHLFVKEKIVWITIITYVMFCVCFYWLTIECITYIKPYNVFNELYSIFFFNFYYVRPISSENKFYINFCSGQLKCQSELFY